MGIIYIYIYVHIQCMTNHHDYGWSWLAFQCVRLSATAAAAVDGTQMGLVFSWILWHVERSGILMDTGYPKITWAVFKTPVAWCFFGGLYYQKKYPINIGDYNNPRTGNPYKPTSSARRNLRSRESCRTCSSTAHVRGSTWTMDLEARVVEVS